MPFTQDSNTWKTGNRTGFPGDRMGTAWENYSFLSLHILLISYSTQIQTLKHESHTGGTLLFITKQMTTKQACTRSDSQLRAQGHPGSKKPDKKCITARMPTTWPGISKVRITSRLRQQILLAQLSMPRISEAQYHINLPLQHTIFSRSQH